jgi:hypothetical protein
MKRASGRPSRNRGGMPSQVPKSSNTQALKYSEAIIDTDVFVENAKKFGTYCAANPTISIVNAAEKILGN